MGLVILCLKIAGCVGSEISQIGTQFSTTQLTKIWSIGGMFELVELVLAVDFGCNPSPISLVVSSAGDGNCSDLYFSSRKWNRFFTKALAAVRFLAILTAHRCRGFWKSLFWENRTVARNCWWFVSILGNPAMATVFHCVEPPVKNHCPLRSKMTLIL